jgi:hypothetical protein
MQVKSSRRGGFRRSTVLLSLALVTIVASSCLIAPTTSIAPYLTYDIPDPAMYQFFSAAAVWGTSTCETKKQPPTYNCGSNLPNVNIPSYDVFFTGNQAPEWNGDALPTLPQKYDGYKTQATWAPSVRLIDGQWVMVYSQWFDNSAQANCIGWATAPPLGTTFTPQTTVPFCSGNTTHGYLDPSIFIDSNTGTPYLLWSEEWSGGSTLWIQPLAANGLSVVTSDSAEPLLTFSEATTMVTIQVP